MHVIRPDLPDLRRNRPMCISVPKSLMQIRMRGHITNMQDLKKDVTRVTQDGQEQRSSALEASSTSRMGIAEATAGLVGLSVVSH